MTITPRCRDANALASHPGQYQTANDARSKFEISQDLVGRLQHCDSTEQVCRLASLCLHQILGPQSTVFVGFNSSGIGGVDLAAVQPGKSLESTGRCTQHASRLWHAIKHLDAATLLQPRRMIAIDAISAEHDTMALRSVGGNVGDVPSGYVFPIGIEELGNEELVGMIVWYDDTRNLLNQAQFRKKANCVFEVAEKITAVLPDLLKSKTVGGCTDATDASRAAASSDASQQETRWSHVAEPTVKHLIGASPQMNSIRQCIQRLANVTYPVLITGESGVGKELIAQAIHSESPRRNGPFVCLNGSAITDSLFESDLFGHEKGAFTNATSQKPGKFEQANGGTLFLDEVGEMPLGAQAKLLRALEGKTFERVGGSQGVSVDVRVIAASSRAHDQLANGDCFRSELFHRLNVLSIHVPPLRERRSDIRLLSRVFLNSACHELGKPRLQISDDVFEHLEAHSWPGNIRELKNTMDRLAVLVDGRTVNRNDLCLTAVRHPNGGHANDRFTPRSLKSLERDHILKTLSHVGWKKRRAADLLGINRSTLDRKLARYGIAGDHPSNIAAAMDSMVAVPIGPPGTGLSQ